MNKKQKRDLELLSRLDPDVVEKQTRKRAQLMRGCREASPRRMTAILAAAAALLLVLSSVLVLVKLLGKQVPVYTGMTLSSQPPVTSVASASLDALTYNAPGTDNGNHNGHYKGDVVQSGGGETQEGKPLSGQLAGATPVEELYYAKQNEDVYITVHFDNPDNFVILSFTLNGRHYASYMFEDGSDMENIVVKVNVGDAEGVVEYTIDAIKYVHSNNKIKDVKMQGEKTVKIGVYTEAQPTAAISSEAIGFYDVAFAVDVSDGKTLIEKSGGSLRAVLYDGQRILREKPLSGNGTESVRFEGLDEHTPYTYAVIARYNAMDGQGMAEHILFEKRFSTKTTVLFDNVTLTAASISFDYRWDADYPDKRITALTLSGGEERVLDPATTLISGLRGNTRYLLTATFGDGKSISLEFTTAQLTYTVRHYLLGVDGNAANAVLTDTKTYVIEEGDTVSAPQLTYAGFLQPAAKTVEGNYGLSLVVEYYYARIGVVMTLDRGDGSAPIVQTMKYGQALPVFTRDGYVLQGWYTDAACTSPIDTVPLEAATLYARWVEATGIANLKYEDGEGGGIVITGLYHPVADLNIPSYIDGKRVTHIASNAFANSTDVVNVYIPEDVTVGSSAFYHCSSLQSIVMARGVALEGGETFCGCVNLEHVQLPSTLTALPKNAFGGCTSLERIVIPANVEAIGTGAFSGCTALEEFIVAEGSLLRTVELGFLHNVIRAKTVVLVEGVDYHFWDIAPNFSSINTIIYYLGTKDGMQALQSELNAMGDWDSKEQWWVSLPPLYGAKWYLYSPQRPDGDGDYWHYVDGIPTVWD